MSIPDVVRRAAMMKSLAVYQCWASRQWNVFDLALAFGVSPARIADMVREMESEHAALDARLGRVGAVRKAEDEDAAS